MIADLSHILAAVVLCALVKAPLPCDALALSSGLPVSPV